MNGDRRDALISVIVPIYNMEKYLPECVDSIRKQTYGNLEILLVDDGSTDGSLRTCEEYAKKDSRIRVIHRENGGLSAARNTGLDQATGDWIGFVDSDDWVEPDLYETLLTLAQEHQAEVACSRHFREYVNGHAPVSNTGKVDVLHGMEEIARGKLSDGSFDVAVWNKLYVATFFADGLRFPVGKKHEDHLINYHIMLDCNTVVCIDRPLYHYRQRKGSIVHAPSVRSMLDMWELRKDGYDKLKDMLPQDLRIKLIYDCGMSINKVWASAAVENGTKVREYKKELKEIADFCKKHCQEIAASPFGAYVKFVFRVARHDNKLAFYTIFSCYKISLFVKGVMQGKKWVTFE